MYKQAKVIMLPSDNTSGGIYMQNNILYSHLYNFENVGKFFKPYHLYIVSDDEIGANDWVYSNVSYTIIEFINTTACTLANNQKEKTYFKIIASTDSTLKLPSIPDQFTKQYCDKGKIEEVYIEYHDTLLTTENKFGVYEKTEVKSVPKLQIDNTIIIKEIKTNYTKEEVIELCREAFQAGVEYDHDSTMTAEFSRKSTNPLNEDDWIKENI